MKQIFWKTKLFFKKLKYRFLVEIIKIEHASFPYKTATLEANITTNRIVSTNWTRILLVTTLLFWKFCFSLLTSYKELFWCTNYPSVRSHAFCKCYYFIWGWFFFVSILEISFTLRYKKCPPKLLDFQEKFSKQWIRQMKVLSKGLHTRIN